jgi:hypothetical protein
MGTAGMIETIFEDVIRRALRLLDEADATQ